MNIEYKDFEKHLNNVKKILELENSLIDVCNQAYHNNMDCDIHFPSLVDDVINLLSIATDDKDGYIEYWAYELDCGDEYRDGMITDKDNKVLKLKTVEDLWNCIHNDR